MRTAVALAAACLALLAGGCARRSAREILFFYSAICPSCAESQRALDAAAEVAWLARGQRRAAVRVYDVTYGDGVDDLLEALDRYKVPLEKQSLPLLIVDGVAYSGEEEVRSALGELSGERRSGGGG